MPEPDALERLAADGLVSIDAAGTRTTRRWQAALARAAVRLQRMGAPWRDLRLPIASALLELYPDATDEELARRIEALLPLEQGLVPAGAESPDLASSR
jgi:hypothetical protein